MRLSKCLLLLFLLVPSTVLGASPIKVVVGASETRTHAYFELPSGLKVLVVSDPSARLAIGALTVDIGLESDPPDRPGLAHLLEHALFASNAKYPEEHSILDFFGRHGGFINAETTILRTQYYWAIRPDYLESALDRFAQMFIEPRFDPQSVAKEREAVDAEFASRSLDDVTREMAVYQHLFYPATKRPRTFPGDAASLGGDTTQLAKALKALFVQEYSADHMALTVVGRQSTKQLEAMVRRYFSAIPKRPWQPPFLPTVFGHGLPSTFLEIHGSQGYRALTFAFLTDRLLGRYRSKPHAYVESLLSYDGPGSVEYALALRGWAKAERTARIAVSRAKEIDVVRFMLTPDGVGHTKEIGDMLFKYIGLIRRHANTVKYFDERARGAALTFRFYHEEHATAYARSTSRRLTEYPARDVISEPFAWDSYDHALVDRLLAAYGPDRVMVSLMSPAIKGDTDLVDYDTKYTSAPISSAWLKDWKRAVSTDDDRFLVPPLSPFDPDVPKHARVGHVPLEQLLAGKPVWYEATDRFSAPRIWLEAQFSAPGTSPDDWAYLDIYLAALRRKLSAVRFEGSIFNYRASVRTTGPDGLRIRVSGYTGAFAGFLDAVTAQMAHVDVDQQDYRLFALELRQGTNAMLKSGLDKLLPAELVTLLDEHGTPPTEMSARLKTISWGGYRRWQKQFKTSLSGSAVIVGNLSAATARRLAASLAVIAPMHFTSSGQATVKLTRTQRRVEEFHGEQHASMVLYYVQAPHRNVAMHAEMALVAPIMNSMIYQAFRYQKNLGYMARSGLINVHGVPGFYALLESPRVSAEQLIALLSDRVNKMAEVLDVMPDSQFKRIKTSISSRIFRTANSLDLLGARVAGDIFEQHDPGYLEKLHASMNGLTRVDVSVAYRAFIQSIDTRSVVLYSRGSMGGASLSGIHIDSAKIFRAHEGTFRIVSNGAGG